MGPPDRAWQDGAVDLYFSFHLQRRSCWLGGWKETGTGAGLHLKSMLAQGWQELRLAGP